MGSSAKSPHDDGLAKLNSEAGGGGEPQRQVAEASLRGRRLRRLGGELQRRVAETARRRAVEWASTIASIWIQASCGASYTFGIYSSTLKSSQSYSQSTLDTVSIFKDIGANAGVISGLFYSAVTEKRGGRSSAGVGRRPRSVLSPGPWLVLVAGAVQFFAGYFFIWASIVGLIDRPPVAAMCLFMWVAAHAQTSFNTTNVVSGVHNFSDYSGTIVGIMKGFLGLSGAILIQV
ncbi:uncharacterized protein LOC120289915 [Eucalyptus grandis]|uniref:uncharacterized protein LOC120289915 n=1 Tax=Eucalyptus grandis TaxID=71139 RepID=UPI00192E8B61|nr:uncharacterized protein LOC120289915 [Eucalyptus grandis]